MPNVTCIVVTYNRKALLEECLDALLAQSFALHQILVFNNCSTDGTELLFEKGAKYDLPVIRLVNSPENLGGAGGFSKGIELASKEDCDWIWIMDDDTIPDPTALEELMRSAALLDENKESYGYLASYVYGPNREPMNVPGHLSKTTENGYSYWYKYLDHGMVTIREATFVSIIVKNEAVKKLGYPIAEYFIWGDDTEYTSRLTKEYGVSYMCGKSKVCHKRFNAGEISIYTEPNKNRVKMYRYQYRNVLYNTVKYENSFLAFAKCVWFFIKSFIVLFKPHVQHRGAKFCAIQRGLWSFVFHPRHPKKEC